MKKVTNYQEEKRSQMSRKIVEKLLLGEGINEICRTMKVGKHRVMKVRDAAGALGYLDKTTPLPGYPEKLFPEMADKRSTAQSANSEAYKLLEPHLEWIKERLASGWHKVTVFEELASCAQSVPRSSFYRFVHHHGLTSIGSQRVIPEIIHMPGEALLLDWGYLWTIEHEGKRKKLWIFVGVLGFSRLIVATIMVCCDQEHTLDALTGMYEQIGGIPTRTTIDNPKVFTHVACKFEPILNPVFERFASHNGTIIEALPPADPEKKGKVSAPCPLPKTAFGKLSRR